MQFQDLDSIVECLRRWDKIRNSRAEVVNYLDTGNYFKLKRDKPTAANLHAYPGIGPDDALYFFILDADTDKSGSEIDLFQAITACVIERQYGNGDQIPAIEAVKRIDKWKSDFPEWVADQIDQEQLTQGVFKAFNIPAAYAVRNTEYAVVLGLKEDGSSVTNYAADLITVDSSKSSAVFYDTVRPVPPFDSTLPESSFYLLSLV